MAHSKRNTSLAFFTAHERSQLRSTWGSQSQRLTRDSFLPFGSCMLCLQPCEDPVACNGGVKVTPDKAATNEPPNDQSNGSKKRKREDEEPAGRKEQCHLFCRECIMSNLLSQRKEIKRLERQDTQNKAEAAELETQDDDAAKQKAIQVFERVQQGLEADPSSSSSARGKYEFVSTKSTRAQTDHPKSPPPTTQDPLPPTHRITTNGHTQPSTEDTQTTPTTSTRPFDLNEADLLRIAQADRATARQALHDEQAAEASKNALPSFWVPALTPSDGSKKGSNVSEVKKTPLCPGSFVANGSGHSLSLKLLVSVRFTRETQKREGGAGVVEGNGTEDGNAASKKGLNVSTTCPACSRVLSNASRAVLSKPCGHVLCVSCVERFVVGDEGDVVGVGGDETVKPLRCFVCEEDLTPKPKKEKDKDKEKIRPGLVDICCEGTGFAKGGRNVVKVQGTAFQC